MCPKGLWCLTWVAAMVARTGVVVPGDAHSVTASSFHACWKRAVTGRSPVATGGHRSEAAISLWRMPTFITADARTRFEPIVTNESAATASDTLNYSSVYISAALIARLRTPRALIQSSAGRARKSKPRTAYCAYDTPLHAYLIRIAAQ